MTVPGKTAGESAKNLANPASVPARLRRMTPRDAEMTALVMALDLLGEVTSTLAPDDVAYCGRVDLKSSGQDRISHTVRMFSPNCNDIIRCQFSRSVKSVLSFSISHIIKLSSDEQMRWPNTRSIVAVMQDIQAGWDRAMSQFPGDTMSGQRLARVSSSIYLTVTIWVDTSRPNPTVARSVDLSQEPRSQSGWCWTFPPIQRVARRSAKDGAAVSDRTRPCRKKCAALQACALNGRRASLTGHRKSSLSVSGGGVLQSRSPLYFIISGGVNRRIFAQRRALAEKERVIVELRLALSRCLLRRHEPEAVERIARAELRGAGEP